VTEEWAVLRQEAALAAAAALVAAAAALAAVAAALAAVELPPAEPRVAAAEARRALPVVEAEALPARRSSMSRRAGGSLRDATIADAAPGCA
jgi:hypothetical protein